MPTYKDFLKDYKEELRASTLVGLKKRLIHEYGNNKRLILMPNSSKRTDLLKDSNQNLIRLRYYIKRKKDMLKSKPRMKKLVTSIKKTSTRRNMKKR